MNEDQEALRQSVRGFLASTSSLGTTRGLLEAARGYDQSMWLRAAVELGLQGLAIPERLGGQGFGIVELAVVFEELGRVLSPAPFFGSVALATHVLALSQDTTAQERYMPGLASGELVATVGLLEDDDDWSDIAGTLAADASDGGFRISGTKRYVIDAPYADLMIVPATLAGSGPTLFAVDLNDAAVEVETRPTLDLTRRQGTVKLTNVAATRIGADGTARETLASAMDLAGVCLAFEQLGGAEVCLETTVQYVKLRTQFGRAIGEFQAIKHQCARMKLAVESTRAVAYEAAAAANRSPEELHSAVATAQAVASESYVACADTAIHLHGGVGFTWENDLHLYFRRAHADAVLLGDSEHHRRTLVSDMGSTP